MRTNDPYSVADLQLSAVLQQPYDLFVAASGHETRARYLSELIHRRNIRAVSVLGFDTYQTDGARVDNDDHFRRKWGEAPIQVSNRSDNAIYDFLSKHVTTDDAHVLVDYSSMTRFWYAAILNWMRFQTAVRQITVDLVYTRATYPTTEMPRLEIEEILCIPGCEGSTAASGLSVALIGLGFDTYSTQCVLDDLEPDVAIPFIAGGTARSDYVERVKLANEELATRCKDILELPLESVELTLIRLAEVIAPFQAGSSVSVVPLGPKPHVLASILLSMRFPRVGCLHVSGRRQAPWDAAPTSDLVCTRVVFQRYVQRTP